jgi:hypothetical protein
LNLQVLFPSLRFIAARELAGVLRELHPSLAKVEVEFRTGDLGHGLGIGQTARVQWDRHRVLMAFIHSPVPAMAVEWVENLSDYDAVLKAQAKSHTAHATLAYRGQETDPLEQYLALTTIAAGLARLGAIVVTNASARSFCPAPPLLPRPGEDLLDVLGRLPLPLLFVGFHQFAVPNMPGLWMRTCGAPLMDMPDLALHAASLDESKTVFQMFDSIFKAMRGTQVRFKEGDMVQLEELNWRFRKPRSKEGFLESPRMIVLEPDTSPDRVRLP